MKKVLKINVFLIIIFCVSLGHSQDQPPLQFIETTHDFGAIQEEGDVVTFSFEFTNTTATPITISSVKASCGCTTTKWTKTPILSGKQGFVQAQYNPYNRPGSFYKSLTITSNAQPNTVTVYIKGKVIPRVKSIAEEMSYLVSGIRWKSKSLQMGKMTDEKVVSRNFELYNDSDIPIVLLSKIEGPNFISIVFDPIRLKPKQKGIMTVAYNPQHDNHFGFNNHGIAVSTNLSESKKANFDVLATITEYFPAMSVEQLAKAPKLNIADRYQDLGKVLLGTKIEAEFKLTNVGSSPLNIRKVKSNCACFVATLSTYDLQVGESTLLKATFDATDRRGGQNKSITIYTNDPQNPAQIISIQVMIYSTN